MNVLRYPAHSRLFSAAAETEAYDKIASLSNVRGVIRLGGAGLIHFLQGLITNDVSSMEQPSDSIMYSCILNAQGRYVHDMFLFRSSSDPEPSLLLDTDIEGKTDLLRLLKLYRLRQKIDIDDVSSDYTVWVTWNELKQQHKQQNKPALPWLQDPRLSLLGHRTIVPSSSGATTLATTLVTGDTAPKEVPWEEFKRWRMLNGVAEGNAEMPPGTTIPFDFNIDGLQGISFAKGCYVGQELMARTHYKGVVRKRLMPLKLSNLEVAGGKLAPGAGVYDSSDVQGPSKPLGKVQLVQGDLGLAVLRLGPIMKALDEVRPLYVESSEGGVGNRLQVEVNRPQWWPQTWGREEE